MPVTGFCFLMSGIPGFSENFDGKTVFRTPTNPPPFLGKLMEETEKNTQKWANYRISLSFCRIFCHKIGQKLKFDTKSIQF